ncbi:MAG: ribosome maturation factor RimM [Anaerolineae bacterium]|nr:ribosome maturation factor RimM [Anaerolineae bacterium]
MSRVADGQPLRDENGSVGRDLPAEPRFLIVGQVRAPHGVRGEVRVQILTDFPERFRRGAEICIGPEHRRYTIQTARFHEGDVLIKLVGLDDRNAVEGFRGAEVTVPVEEAMPLPEGTFYVHQIVGLRVWTDAGEPLGTVSEVLSLPANDVYVVNTPQGEIWLPAISDVILDIDLAQGRMTVHLLPGLV